MDLRQQRAIISDRDVEESFVLLFLPFLEVEPSLDRRPALFRRVLTDLIDDLPQPDREFARVAFMYGTHPANIEKRNAEAAALTGLEHQAKRYLERVAKRALAQLVERLLSRDLAEAVRRERGVAIRVAGLERGEDAELFGYRIVSYQSHFVVTRQDPVEIDVRSALEIEAVRPGVRLVTPLRYWTGSGDPPRVQIDEADAPPSPENSFGHQALGVGVECSYDGTLVFMECIHLGRELAPQEREIVRLRESFVDAGHTFRSYYVVEARDPTMEFIDITVDVPGLPPEAFRKIVGPRGRTHSGLILNEPFTERPVRAVFPDPVYGLAYGIKWPDMYGRQDEFTER